MSSRPALVVADDVALGYVDGYGRATVAVERATFDVRRGETFAIVGPSGCGKTTLLKAIAGFIHPTHGTLAIDGALAPEPGPDRAVVFQDFDQLFAWRTIRGNITYALRVARGIRDAAARSRADAMLALVDITRAAERYPHELSGGMKQRAAIARALALEPALLLMDEPFGALDAITRAQLQLELQKIKATTPVTIVIVTHSIEEAVFLGDRVMVMSAHPARIREIVDTSAIVDFESAGFGEAVLRLRDLLVMAPHEAG